LFGINKAISQIHTNQFPSLQTLYRNSTKILSDTTSNLTILSSEDFYGQTLIRYCGALI